MKEVKAPFMYDGYRGISLHATQGNRASSRGKGKVSFFSPLSSGTSGIFSRNGQEGPLKFIFFHRHHDSCLVARDTSGFYLGKESQ